MCKKHFLDRIKQMLRANMKSMYRDPGEAYVALDTDGKGHITQSDLLKSHPVQRVLSPHITLGDVIEGVTRDNLFKSSGKMDVDTFKHAFFP